MNDWGNDPRTAPFGSPPNSVSGRSQGEIPAYVAAEIVSYVQQELSKHGVAGRVEYYSGAVQIAGNPGGPSVNVTTWGAVWPRMDEQGRQRRAMEAARQLASTISSTAPVARKQFVLDVRILGALAILLLSGVWIFFEDLTPAQRGGVSGEEGRGSVMDRGEPEPSDSDLPVTKERATTGRDLGDARSSRVCANTMTRVFQGGTVSVADVDGWLVEISLLKVGGSAPLDTHPALNQFVENPSSSGGSRFIWKEEAGLAPVTTSDTVVTVTRTTVGEGAERIPGVTLSFGGSLVDAYFTEAGRARYFHVATALSDVLQATHSALYARCFDNESHALGSWFRGLDAPGAAAALTYYMGTFANPMHLARPFYALPGEQGINRPHTFKSIVDKTRLVSRTDLSTLVGKDGGMASGKDGNQVVITFPFRDGNRASRSSRSIARVTRLSR